MPKNVWMFWRRGRSPEPEPEESNPPEPPWFVLKVGGFKIEIDQASARAIGPALPVVLRFGWRSLPYIGCVLIGGIGTASVNNNELLAQLVKPADPVVEEICPQQ